MSHPTLTAAALWSVGPATLVGVIGTLIPIKNGYASAMASVAITFGTFLLIVTNL